MLLQQLDRTTLATITFVAGVILGSGIGALSSASIHVSLRFLAPTVLAIIILAAIFIATR